MKKIRIILCSSAFLLAAIGVFAFNNMAVVDNARGIHPQIGCIPGTLQDAVFCGPNEIFSQCMVRVTDSQGNNPFIVPAYVLNSPTPCVTPLKRSLP